MKKHIKNYFKHFDLPFDAVVLCEYCGSQAQDIHHCTYKSQGGKDDIDNLIALCRSCHDKAHFKKEPYLTKEELKQITNNR